MSENKTAIRGPRGRALSLLSWALLTGLAASCNTLAPHPPGASDGVPRTVLPRLSLDGPWRACELDAERKGACIGRVPSPPPASMPERQIQRRLLRAISGGQDLEYLAKTVANLEAELDSSFSADALVDLMAGRLVLALAGDQSQAARVLEESDEWSSAPTEKGQAGRLCFNRALAFEQLGLVDPALRTWRDCVSRLEEGWRSEAEERLATLQKIGSECSGTVHPSLPAPTGRNTPCEDRESTLRAGLRALFGENGRSAAASEDPSVVSVLDAGTLDNTGHDILQEVRQGGKEVEIGGAELLKGLESYGRRSFGDAVPHLSAAQERFDPRNALHAIAKVYELGAALYDRPSVRHDLDAIVAKARDRRWGWAVVYGSRLLSLLSSRTESPLVTLPMAESALDTARRFGYEGQSIDLGIMLAETYSSLQRTDKAWEVAAQTLRQAYHHGGASELFFALNLATGIAEEQGLQRLALLLQSEALRQGSSQPARTRASAYCWLALLRAPLGELEQASLDLRRASELAAEVNDGSERHELRAELELGRAALELAVDPKDAAQLLSHAIATFKQYSLSNRLRALEMRSDAFHSLGLEEAAAKDLVEAIELATRGGGPTSATLKDRVSFQGWLAKLTSALVALQLDGGRPWDALLSNDKWRGISVADALADGPRRGQRLVEALSKGLKPGQAVVEFGRAGTGMVAWVVRPKAEECDWKRLGSAEDLRTILSLYENALSQEDRRRRLAELYELLVVPLHLERASELIIIPAVGFEAVPFPSLVSPADRLLIQDALLRFAPSALDMVRAKRRATSPSKSRDLSGAGLVAHSADPPLAKHFSLPPLAAASDEIAAIDESARQAKASVLRLRESDATPTKILESLPRSKWAHLIGHTTPGPTSIVPPALLLEPDEQERNWITADDIARLDLSGLRFVVLSTCSSAVRGPDGWLSRALLARGFLEAGTHGVIASLGPVDDRESADLFRLTYQQLVSGKPIAEALRAAQLELLGSSNGEPGTWLSFVYLGRN